ncbi:MAG: hypothetical protein AAF747_09530 [Planctomycetota bacterium]
MTDGSNQTAPYSLPTWPERLAGAGDAGLKDTPANDPTADLRAWVGGFRDEFGHRRLSDRLVLRRALGLEADAADTDPRPEHAVWLAPDAWRELIAEPSASGPAPLLPDLHDAGIEAWTEAELIALHGLASIADARDRVARAAEWHVAELQPDNATNRPWAIHSFIRLGTPEGEHFAQTMLHNCCVTLGKPDIVSAAILRDAASSL